MLRNHLIAKIVLACCVLIAVINFGYSLCRSDSSFRYSSKELINLQSNQVKVDFSASSHFVRGGIVLSTTPNGNFQIVIDKNGHEVEIASSSFFDHWEIFLDQYIKNERDFSLIIRANGPLESNLTAVEIGLDSYNAITRFILECIFFSISCFIFLSASGSLRESSISTVVFFLIFYAMMSLFSPISIV